MKTLLLVAVLLGLAAFGYRHGRRRALAIAGGDARRLHSLPGYHGLYVALWCAVPALVVLVVWISAAPAVIETLVISRIPGVEELSPAQRNLLANDVKNLASGNIASRGSDPALTAAADRYRDLRTLAFASLAVVVLLLGLGGLAFARRRISAELRAITKVEKTIKAFLFAGSTVAVLTTLGIVLSLLFEALRPCTSATRDCGVRTRRISMTLPLNCVGTVRLSIV
jgi:phosphate transport system permease protein